MDAIIIQNTDDLRACAGWILVFRETAQDKWKYAATPNNIKERDGVIVLLATVYRKANKPVTPYKMEILVGYEAKRIKRSPLWNQENGEG